MKEKRIVKRPRMKSRKKVNFKRRQKSKRFVNRIFIVLSFLGVLCGVIYGLALLAGSLFRLNEITIEGNTVYSDTEILDVAGFSHGQGLLFLNTSEAEKNLYEKFPYIDEVRVHKQFPSKLQIDISMATRRFSIFKDDVFYVISEKGKLMETLPELPSETIELRGIEFEIDQNRKIVYTDSDSKEMLVEIEKEVAEVGLNNIRIIDLSNPENMVINYDDRISIIIGSKEDLHYKIVTAKEIISNKINQFEKGELDLSYLTKDNKSYFIPTSE